jgi:hypothetical protein
MRIAATLASERDALTCDVALSRLTATRPAGFTS